jgi:hypothetical protein
MSLKYHMCNATDGNWAYVAVHYYSDNCTLLRYNYTDPHSSLHLVFLFQYIYYLIYFLVTFLFFPLLIYYLCRRMSRYISPEGDALLARHPDGYWANQFGDNAPFGNFFRGLLRRQ